MARPGGAIHSGEWPVRGNQGCRPVFIGVWYCLRHDNQSRRRPRRVFGKRLRQTSASDLVGAGFANPVTPLHTERQRKKIDQSVTLRARDETSAQTHPAHLNC